MTSTVLLLKDAADHDHLRRAAPGVEIVEVGSIDSLPQAAARATVIALRSGVYLGEQHLTQLPALRHVVRVGSGTDNIDLAALNRRGITLHRNPQASAAAVAEWTLTAALCLTRRIPLGHNGLALGLHTKTACMGAPLSELNVAVWGAGPVGQAIGQLLTPFARRVTFAHWPSTPPELLQQPARALIGETAVHVVALPLRPETHQLFGEAFLAQVAAHRPLLICAGRVETLDLAACLRAVEEQRLGGLALDAVEPEHIPLLRAASEPLNLLTTPHIGAQRRDVRSELDVWVGELFARLTRDEADASTAPGGQR